MKVYCRCKKCNKLFNVEYNGNAFKCPSCGINVLSENDSRVPADYTEIKNGNLNVIGDEVDEMIANTDASALDDLFGKLVGMERRHHEETVSKIAKPIDKADLYDVVKFGNLFWIVICEKDGSKLLLSRECMAFDLEFGSKLYHSGGSSREGDYQWESSVYREYLNEDFYSKNFSKEDQKKIIPFENEFDCGEDGQKHSLNDKVFLLSREEVENYIPDQEKRIGYMFSMYEEIKRPWFLRLTSDMSTQPYVVGVDGDFELLPKGYFINWFRPAIWI